MELTDILLGAFIVLFLIQLFVMLKIFNVTHQFTRLLIEIRMLFKNAGIKTDTKKNIQKKEKICKNCTYRLTYIKMSENEVTDDFYYKCKKRNVQIQLTESCKYFEWESSIKK